MSMVITVRAKTAAEIDDLYQAVTRYVNEDIVQQEFGERDVVIEPNGADLGSVTPEELMNDIVDGTDEVRASDIRIVGN